MFVAPVYVFERRPPGYEEIVRSDGDPRVGWAGHRADEKRAHENNVYHEETGERECGDDDDESPGFGHTSQ